MNVLQIRHVLCPMDLSPVSMNALEWANAVARVRRAELRMLHVVAPGGIAPAEGLAFGERFAEVELLNTLPIDWPTIWIVSNHPLGGIAKQRSRGIKLDVAFYFFRPH